MKNKIIALFTYVMLLWLSSCQNEENIVEPIEKNNTNFILAFSYKPATYNPIGFNVSAGFSLDGSLWGENRPVVNKYILNGDTIVKDKPYKGIISPDFQNNMYKINFGNSYWNAHYHKMNDIIANNETIDAEVLTSAGIIKTYLVLPDIPGAVTFDKDTIKANQDLTVSWIGDNISYCRLSMKYSKFINGDYHDSTLVFYGSNSQVTLPATVFDSKGVLKDIKITSYNGVTPESGADPNYNDGAISGYYYYQSLVKNLNKTIVVKKDR